MFKMLQFNSNSENLNCIAALSSFSDLFRYYHDFWTKIEVAILVTPKQEVDPMQIVLRCEFSFYSWFKGERDESVLSKTRSFLACGYCLQVEL